MYSVVLMAAMTTGPELVDCHRRRRNDCGGCYAASHGCHGGGGYGGGCHGGFYGGGCHGGAIYGGGYGGAGCHGGVIHGGHFGGAGCHGGAIYGGGYDGGAYYGGGGVYGGGYYGGTGGGAVLPTPTPGKGGTGGKGGDGGAGKKGGGAAPIDNDEQGDSPTAATILVNLPANATLTVDGHATTSTSSSRLLVTPALQPGFEYTYTLRAELVRDGQRVQQSQNVRVRAGAQARVQLDFPQGTATSSR